MPQVKSKAAAAAAPVQGSVAASAAPAGGLSPRLSTVVPAQMIGGGLASQFWGRILKKRFLPRTYPSGKQAGKYFLAVEVVIQAEESSLGKNGIVTELLNAGDLKHWVPCMDGANPTAQLADFAALADGTGQLQGENPQLEGVYALGIGTQESTSPDSKWAQWGRAILDCGFPPERMGVACTYDEGLRCYFTRLPYVDSKGRPPKMDEGQRAPEVLVPTQIDPGELAALQAGKPVTGMNLGAATKTQAAAAKPKAAAAPAQTATAPAPAPAPVQVAAAAVAAPAPAGTVSDLDQRIEQAVWTLLQGADGGQMGYLQLGVPISKMFTGAEIGKAIKTVGNVQWLGSDDRTLFAYDPDQQVVLLMPEEEEAGEEVTA